MYSSRGELQKVILPDGRTITYVNDPLGRRIAKLMDGQLVEKYLWKGQVQLLAILDANDNIVYRFEYADDRVPYAMTTGGQTYYLTYDHIDSLVAVIDSNGNVVKNITYDSFGNILKDSRPALIPSFAYAGGLCDVDTRLVRYGYRDYDPEVGLWTAKDPLIFDGGDVNLYLYVFSNPQNLIDAFGLSPIAWIIKLTSSGFKKVKPLFSIKAAQKARDKGNNVLANRCQTGKAIEKGLSNDPIKHKAHNLKDGSKGMPHYQTNGKSGHTFTSGGISTFLFELLDPFDAISGEIASEDEYMCIVNPKLCDDSCANKCN